MFRQQHGRSLSTRPRIFLSLPNHHRYADVTHEVKPATKGHRLVLTFNLVNAQPASVRMPSASILSQSEQELARIFRGWNVQPAHKLLTSYAISRNTNPRMAASDRPDW